MAFCDLTGQRFGRLTAIRRVGKDSHRLWLFQCDCGNEAERPRRSKRENSNPVAVYWPVALLRRERRATLPRVKCSVTPNR
jgi:hypothetical protein